MRLYLSTLYLNGKSFKWNFNKFAIYQFRDGFQLHTHTNKKVTLHGFSDASEAAYACVVYEVQRDRETTKVVMLGGKSKVAPLKPICIPRLELNGALLLARFFETLCNCLKDYVNIYAWTDSQVVLSWLSFPPRNSKPFVANRTSEILDVIPCKQWRYVPSKENPTDLGSRGMSPKHLTDCSLWWEGPQWLSTDEAWPKQPTIKDKRDIEKSVIIETKRTLVFSVYCKNDIIDMFDKHSSFSKIIHILAFCLRFMQHCKDGKNKKRSRSKMKPLTTSEFRSNMSKQRMGDLPKDRVTLKKPFYCCGIDYAGPVSVLKYRGRGAKTTKGYIVIFVCFATKALHLELGKYKNCNCNFGDRRPPITTHPADSKFNVPGKIDLLLGANIFYELLKPERIKIKDTQLLLVNSVFGYIVTGNLDSINETKVHCGLIRDEDLNKNLEKFWKLEEIEELIVKNKERLICEEHYANTHFRTKEGKYVVSMPLKKEPSCLGNSKDIALKRLGSLWNRLARDDNYLNLYREFLRDYERLGHMKEVTNETEPKIAYYATHHEIYRPEKSTTKLRVVFNSSSLTDNGISLNDIQYNGGVIQEDLYAQMLRFRTYTYAFTADIKMMYRTILINRKQRNLQRIVWCKIEHESPKIYELSTVTYGTVSAPYLAQRTLTQLSMDEEANFPIAASVLRNNLYMDDVLCGAATLEESIVLRQQLKGILKSAGMELHKLCANHEKLSPDPEQNYNFATLTETKTLGVKWKPNLDSFLIKVKVCLDSSYTKRDVLSTIAKIFDPVGLMAPVISKAKIFLPAFVEKQIGME
ncbi:uncharacterized protein TNCV_1489531 [Trichonephila clavipes]|nr:uncharacterized protein TNCV_1489531 [Trichonephila clavipes]